MFLEMLLQCPHRFRLGQAAAHTLEERHAEPIVRPGQDPVDGRFADSVRHNFEGLADVDDEGAGDDGDIDPFAVSVKGLQALDLRRGSLKEEGPPSG